MYLTPSKLYSISTNPKDTRGNQSHKIITWWASGAVSKLIISFFYDKQENLLLKSWLIWTLVEMLFIPCNKRVQIKWTEWAQYIMLLVIEPQSPESGLQKIMKFHKNSRECMNILKKELLKFCFTVPFCNACNQKFSSVTLYLLPFPR